MDDRGDHILGKGGLSLIQQQQLVYAFHRCVAAVSRLGIKSRKALFRMHEMKNVDDIVSAAMAGLNALSKNHEASMSNSRDEVDDGFHHLSSRQQDLAQIGGETAEASSNKSVYINRRDLISLDKLSSQLNDMLRRERKKFLAQAEELQRAKGIYIGKDGKETRLRPKPQQRSLDNRVINSPMKFTKRPTTVPANVGGGSQNSSIQPLNSLDLSAQSSLAEGFEFAGGERNVAEAGSFGGPP